MALVLVVIAMRKLEHPKHDLMESFRQVGHDISEAKRDIYRALQNIKDGTLVQESIDLITQQVTINFEKIMNTFYDFHKDPDAPIFNIDHIKERVVDLLQENEIDIDIGSIKILTHDAIDELFQEIVGTYFYEKHDIEALIVSVCEEFENNNIAFF